MDNQVVDAPDDVQSVADYVDNIDTSEAETTEGTEGTEGNLLYMSDVLKLFGSNTWRKFMQRAKRLEEPTTDSVAKSGDDKALLRATYRTMVQTGRIGNR